VGVRFFDLVLALVVLAALVLIARQEFPAYESRAMMPPSPTAAAPSPPPTAAATAIPSPASSPSAAP
jgi:hypothetical protein